MHENNEQISADRIILLLAKQHNIKYVQTELDGLADQITRLSNDEVELDEIELLLVALERAGYIDSRAATRLQIEYIRQAGL